MFSASQGFRQAAGSLVNLGNELFLKGSHNDEALKLFDAAHSLLASSPCSNDYVWVVASSHLQAGTKLASSLSSQAGKDGQAGPVSISFPPDLYEEDECDVGPRMLRTPVTVDACAAHNGILLEAIVVFNKGLIHHSNGNILEAKNHYQVASYSANSMVNDFGTAGASVSLQELAMRSNNNLGLVNYLERSEDAATAGFTTSIHFAKPLAEVCKSYRLEYATALSNWCRVNWMRGDIGNNLYVSLKEVLGIRAELLPWDHPDLAASRYNMAVAEYARQNTLKAVSHLLQYIKVSSHRSKDENLDSLDAIPALIFLLLIRHEDKEDTVSQELVRGLRTLQDMRQDEGPNSLGVASVLNFVGTQLFHTQDFDHALTFFMEELRLEDEGSLVFEEHCFGDETPSRVVTCNNIGRILQELGQLEEAMFYYQRALNVGQSNDGGELHTSPIKESVVRAAVAKAKNPDDLSEHTVSSVNLYSTIWYNLGLIHDKLGSFDAAISAFQVSLELRQVILGPDHADVACLLYNIGVIQMDSNHLDQATASFRSALRICRAGNAGQLNDRHVVKTLEKLATMHKSNGNIRGALEATLEVLAIQDQSTEYDAATRVREMGNTQRAIAEIYHATNDLNSAVNAAAESVKNLRMAAEADFRQHPTVANYAMEEMSLLECIDTIEQLVSSLLLLGSLYHEICEPLQAEAVLRDAVCMVRYAIATTNHSAQFSSLFALQEVTQMLASCHCAPKA